jgi:ABC-2 type transport system ATP-binding protein
MIEVEGLTKDYGQRRAVDDLSFRVGAGEVVGFLGPNGAGKTTTLRIVAGFLGPTRGRVMVAGYDVVSEPLRARSQLGYMPEDCPAYPELRVGEYLRFRAELKRLTRGARPRAIERALQLANIAHRRGSLIGQLSKGYRQRLGLADALLASPPLLILDEPTSGLDPNQIREVRDVVRQLAEEHTVVLSTHILAEVEAVCDRALVVHEGRLVAEGTLSELRSRVQVSEGTLVVRKAQLDIPAGFNDLIQARQSLDSDYESLRIRLPDGRSSMEQIIAGFGSAGWVVAEAKLGSVRLEQVFAQLTTPGEAVASDESVGDD